MKLETPLKPEPLPPASPSTLPDTGVLRMARRIATFVIGITVLSLGVAMIVLPGPAFLVIPAGLAILATEFIWARRILHRLKERVYGVDKLSMYK